MSGYSLYILVKANTRASAKRAAEAVLDGFWDDGTLQEGDRGEVDGGEVFRLSECGESKLLSFNRQRAGSARAYLLDALGEASKSGYASLLEVPPAEVKDTLVGFYLRKAGDILNGSFAPWGVVYDSETYECGFTQERIRELMKHPKQWWLVDCTVGP